MGFDRVLVLYFVGDLQGLAEMGREMFVARCLVHHGCDGDTW